MKTYKKLDLYVQMIMIIAWVLLFIAFIFDRKTQGWMFFYFLVGGWQVFSCLAHFFFADYYPYSGRKIYLWTLLLVIVSTIITFMQPESSRIGYLFVMLIFTPIMAIWYCFICYKEVKLYQQKEWIQLK